MWICGRPKWADDKSMWADDEIIGAEGPARWRKDVFGPAEIPAGRVKLAAERARP
jgi:hypothetical protein